MAKKYSKKQWMAKGILALLLLFILAGLAVGFAVTDQRKPAAPTTNAVSEVETERGADRRAGADNRESAARIVAAVCRRQPRDGFARRRQLGTDACQFTVPSARRLQTDLTSGGRGQFRPT